MDLESLLTLIDKVSSSELGSFEMEDGELKLSMKKKKKDIIVTTQEGSRASETVEMPVISKSEETKILPGGNQMKAPLVGTFYNAPSPESDPFVKVGDTVQKGQVLGIIEAMKLMNEIECEYDGVVEAILVSNEQMVEYGQPLFIIR